MRMRNTTDATPMLRRVPTLRGALLIILAIAAAACGPDYPNCETDQDCKEGEFCVNQLCQQCRTDDHCGPGQQCNAGACEDIPGYCTSSMDCAEGEECVDNRCQAAAAPEPEPEPMAAPTGCTIETVYFAFDSATLESSARDVIARNAECIRERGASSVKVTGHTDPRGTEEYNLALGERRAQSVRKYLKSLGVEGSVRANSMGEEMASGTDESGWSTDRKVEFQEQ